MSESTKHKHDSSCDYGIMLSDYTRGLLAENKRLRAALEAIVNCASPHDCIISPNGPIPCGCEFCQAHYVAREALKGGKP